MENQESQFRALYATYLTWQESQKDQTDGYEYERSFVELTQKLNKDLLDMTLQRTPSTSDTTKKKSTPVSVL
ncbi:MAG: hypothetical protein LH609_21135 [Rudanella sp.]|nr:hypothetical protein [Rudanella sp.]